ncbi:MAG: hypothetical protein NTY77_19500 [Elusimicrobia bacterium]|nr:hypothetical protein [Elusimicrobiota bacterium]
MARRRAQLVVEAPPPAFTPLLPRSLTVLLILAWLAVLARGYWHNLVLRPAVLGGLWDMLGGALPQVAPALAARLPWLAALWLSAAALGMLWVKGLRLQAGRGETWLIAAGLGFGTLSLILLGLGAARLYSPPVLKAAFLAAACCALAGARRWWAWLPRLEPSPRERLGPWEGAALCLLALGLVFELCGTMTPEIFYDSLVYHLALPRLYLLKGRLAAVPYNIFSGTPLAVQLLYGLCLSLADEKLASLLHLSFGAAAAATVYAIGRRCFSRAAGLLAACAFFLCPAVLYAGWGCGVDLAAAFLCACALLVMLADGAPSAAGLLLGFACGVKYNVLPVAAVLVAVHAWQARRQGRPWRGAAVMAAAAAAAFSPWLVKDAVLFGNPLYPYLRGLFGDPGWIADWQAFVADVGNRGAAETLFTGAGLRGLLLQPWTTSVGVWPLGDWPGPVFLLAVPWLLLLRPRRPEAKAVLAAAAGGYLAWALATRWVRYMLPVLPLLALCAALAVESGAWPRWLRRLGWLLILYGGLFEIQAAFSQGQWSGQWDCLTGKVSRADYLKTQRPTYPLPYFAAAEFINRALPPDAKVLVLGESRTYYIERDCIAATVFDRNPFWAAAEQARDGEDLLAKVRALGVTHVFVSAEQLVLRKDSPGILPRETARRPAFREFWSRHLKPVFDDREGPGSNQHFLLVCEVVDRLDPAAAPAPDPVSDVLAMQEPARRD